MLPGADALELRLACASFRFSQGFVFVTHVFAEPKSGTEHSTWDAAPAGGLRPSPAHDNVTVTSARGP